MYYLIRDVLLPSSIAISLILGLAVGPARAGDEPSGTEPAVVAAAVAVKPEPGEFEVRMPRTSPVLETAAASEAAEPAGKHCRRVERIGKTTARHCP